MSPAITGSDRHGRVEFCEDRGRSGDDDRNGCETDEQQHHDCQLTTGLGFVFITESLVRLYAVLLMIRGAFALPCRGCPRCRLRSNAPGTRRSGAMIFSISSRSQRFAGSFSTLSCQ
jgi:hypothetical protein